MTLELRNPELLHGAVAVAGDGMLGFLRQMAVGTGTVNQQGITEYEDAETILDRKIELKKGTAAPVFASETATIYWNTTNNDFYLRGTSEYILIVDQSSIGSGGSGITLTKGTVAPTWSSSASDIYWNTNNNDLYLNSGTAYVKIIDQSEIALATGTAPPIFANETAAIYWNTSNNDFYLRGTSSYVLIIDQSDLVDIGTGTAAPVFANETAKLYLDTTNNHVYLRGSTSYIQIKGEERLQKQEETIYIRSTTIPTTPTGGTWDLDTFTPPSNWNQTQKFFETTGTTLSFPTANSVTLGTLAGLATTSSKLYWLDSQNNSVYITDLDGTNPSSFSLAVDGTNPIGIAAFTTSSNNNVITVSFQNPTGGTNNRIVTYNEDGTIVVRWARPNKYNSLLTYGDPDYIYMVKENQLSKFKTSGSNFHTFMQPTDIPLPSGTIVDLTFYNNLVIVAYSTGNIEVYNIDRVNQPLEKFNILGVTPPITAIAATSNTIYVGTATNVYKTTLSSANLYGSIATLPITATVPSYSNPFLLIQNINPVRIIYQRSSTALSSRPTSGSWNGNTFSLPSGWTIGVPDGTDPLYAVTATLGFDGTTITYSIPFLIGEISTGTTTSWSITYGLYDATDDTKVSTNTIPFSHTSGSHTVDINFPATTTTGPAWYFELPSNVTFNHIYNIAAGRSQVDNEWPVVSGHPRRRERTAIFPGATGHYAIEITVA